VPNRQIARRRTRGRSPLARPKFEKTHWLFPTPLVSYAVPDAERLNSALLAEIAARQNAEAGVVRSNRKGWHSESDFFTRSEPAHVELANAVRAAARDATARVAAPGVDAGELGMGVVGWINVNPPGAHNVPHDHPGSFWSGCYYVKNDQPEGEPSNGGSITFIDARSAPAGQPVVRAPAFKALFGVHPLPGALLLFPSNLKHLVTPNDSADDRVTMAFNVFLFPRSQQALG
jgi:uncharacterized protein (TIGR02466 family)